LVLLPLNWVKGDVRRDLVSMLRVPRWQDLWVRQ
jgi:hypothetical protein